MKPVPAPLPEEDGIYWVRMAEKHTEGYQANWDKVVIRPWELIEYHYNEYGYHLNMLGSDEGRQWGDPDNKYCYFVVVQVGPKVEPPNENS